MVQRGAEANMTLEEFIRWRRQEERLIHGEDPDSGEHRDVPPEREDPPERSDPPERAQQNAADINRGDPFQNMTEEEVAAWRTAEDQFLGPG